MRASGLHLAGMLLAEGVVLAVIGGAFGFIASLWGVDWVIRLAPERLPRLADVHVDYRVFLFALLTSGIAGLLVVLDPALHSARTEIFEQLKVAGRALPGGAIAWVRSALVVAQVAIAITLLAGDVISTMLFGMSARDPWTLAAVVVALVAVTSAATIAALRRAAGIEPATALRQD